MIYPFICATLPYLTPAQIPEMSLAEFDGLMKEELSERLFERMLYWEFPGKQRAARKGDWKVVTIKKDAPLELYNIRKDMTESNDLAKEYPEMVEQFEREMKAGRVPSPNWPD